MGLLTIRAAAERLGVAYSTLKRWVHTGRVRTTRTEGGHHRVAEAEIDRLLARQQPEPSAELAPRQMRRHSARSAHGTACTATSTKCGSTASSPKCAYASAINS